eukprot:6490089-Amphidinium_carterae.1
MGLLMCSLALRAERPMGGKGKEIAACGCLACDSFSCTFADLFEICWGRARDSPGGTGWRQDARWQEGISRSSAGRKGRRTTQRASGTGGSTQRKMQEKIIWEEVVVFTSLGPPSAGLHWTAVRPKAKEDSRASDGTRDSTCERTGVGGRVLLLPGLARKMIATCRNASESSASIAQLFLLTLCSSFVSDFEGCHAAAFDCLARGACPRAPPRCIVNTGGVSLSVITQYPRCGNF